MSAVQALVKDRNKTYLVLSILLSPVSDKHLIYDKIFVFRLLGSFPISKKINNSGISVKKGLT